MTAPDFTRSSIVRHERQTLPWFEAAQKDAEKLGATFCRFSIHPQTKHLLKIECWRNPPEHMGALRWSKQELQV